jgi:periodic tryptophan protein 2
MNFKEKVRDVRFSPDDGYIAVALGRKLQVWRTPEMRREFSPFVLHRTYTGHFDDVSCVCWAPNGR